MAISEKLKKLIETLGGVPKSDTIEGAVDDLVGLFEEKREVEMVEVVPLTEFEVINSDGKNIYYPDTDTERLEPGDVYIVNYDGVEYSCEVYVVIQGDAYICGLGDAKLQEEYNEGGNGEPFYFLTTYDFSPNVQLFTSEPGTHTISISQKKETVTPPVVKLGGEPVYVFDLDNPDGGDYDPYFINEAFVNYVKQHGCLPHSSFIRVEGDSILNFTPLLYSRLTEDDPIDCVFITIYVDGSVTEGNNRYNIYVFKSEEDMNNH